MTNPETSRPTDPIEAVYTLPFQDEIGRDAPLPPGTLITGISGLEQLNVVMGHQLGHRIENLQKNRGEGVSGHPALVAYFEQLPRPTESGIQARASQRDRSQATSYTHTPGGAIRNKLKNEMTGRTLDVQVVVGGDIPHEGIPNYKPEEVLDAYEMYTVTTLRSPTKREVMGTAVGRHVFVAKYQAGRERIHFMVQNGIRVAGLEIFLDRAAHEADERTRRALHHVIRAGLPTLGKRRK